MKNKNETGATGMDVISGLLIFMISTAVVISIYYQIYITTVQTKIHQFIIGCVTDIFEKIDLEDYDNVTSDKIRTLIKESGLNDYFSESDSDNHIEYTLVNYKNDSKVTQDLVKKIEITINYTVGGRTITLPINKIKVRE